jgi:hypothetical protein
MGIGQSWSFHLPTIAHLPTTQLPDLMSVRRDLVKLLSVQPRSVSSIAREMGLDRGDVEGSPAPRHPFGAPRDIK